MISNDEAEAGTRLVVERTEPRDIKMRGLEVLLDGEHWTDLPFGEVVARDISAGHHVLKVTNTLYSREIQFEAQPGRESKFSTGNVIRGFGAMMFVAFGIDPYNVFLEQQDLN